MYRITIDSSSCATHPAAAGGAPAAAQALEPGLTGVASAAGSTGSSLQPASPSSNVSPRSRRISTGPRATPFCVQKAKEASQRYSNVMRGQDSKSPALITAKAHAEVLRQDSLQRTDARAHLIRPRSHSEVSASRLDEDVLMTKLAADSADYERAIDMRFRTWRKPGNFVFRVVTASTLERYREEGAIRTRYAGDPLLRHTYFGQYHGKSPRAHCCMLQMPPPPSGEQLVLLKVPAMALLNMKCPRGEYGKDPLGRELYTHSYAQFGEGGVAQVLAYTTTFSDDWIQAWEADD
jgi:hypothetical protein